MPEKTKVFISYSRKNREPVEFLREALSSQDGITVFRDVDDILPSEEWRSRLERLILESDVVIFALSPDSVRSEVCEWELQYSEKLNKKIIPVVVEEIQGEIPNVASKLNYTFLLSEEDKERALTSVLDAIALDIGWVREQTRLGEQADRWNRGGAKEAQVLRGKELDSAERWLSSQPKEGPSPTDLQRRFIYESRRAATRRQRSAVLGAVFAVVAFGAIALFAVMQRNIAIENKEVAVANEKRAEEERDRAERNFATAQKAIDGLVFDIAIGLEDVEGMSLTSLTRILSKAESALDDILTGDPENIELLNSKVAMLQQFSELYASAGDVDTGLAKAEAASEISRDMLRREPSSPFWLRNLEHSLNRTSFMRVRRGDAAMALAAQEEALGIARELAGLDPSNTEWQRDLSLGLTGIGERHAQAGEDAAALSAYEEALDINRRLAAALDPSELKWQSDLAGVLNRIGDIHAKVPNVAAALNAYEEGLDIERRLAELDPSNTTQQFNVALILTDIGDLHGRSREVAAAKQAYYEALEIHRRLAALDPANTDWLNAIVVNLERLGNVHIAEGDNTAAIKNYEEALDEFRRLTALDPANALWLRSLSILLDKIGDLHVWAGEETAAMEAYEEGLGVHRRLAALDPSNHEWQRDLAVSLEGIGDLHLKAGQADTALAAYKEALPIFRRVANKKPKSFEGQWDAYGILVRVGDQNLRADRFGGALAAHEEALDFLSRLETIDPKSTTVQNFFWENLGRIGDIHLRVGESEEARTSYEQALEHARRLVAADPNSEEWQMHLVTTLWDLSFVQPAPDATAGLEQALNILRALAKTENLSAGNADVPRQVAVRLAGLKHDTANQAFNARDFAQAYSSEASAVALWREDPALSDASPDYLSDRLATLAYYALFVGEDRAAEAAAREALSITPENIIAEGNLALAEMFLGEGDAARTRFLRWQGTALWEGMTWENAVRDDFALLRSIGRGHPLMAEIEMAFGESESPRSDE